MKLTTILILFALLQVSAKGFSQITLDAQHVSLENVLRNIEKQTDYVFFYKGKLRDVSLNVHLKNASLEEALDECFRNLPFSYKIIKKTVVISAIDKVFLISPGNDESVIPYQITGSITDSLGTPLPGAIVRIKGRKISTTSDSEGRYYITAEKNDVLVFSYIGLKTLETKVAGRKTIDVRLMEMKTALGEVVVTGMMDRKKESFTGAAVTFSGDQLKMIGNQNIIQSLKTLDPSFIVLENNSKGSNPNNLPNIELRGKSGLSQTELRDKFGGDPNQPLFILDGFETDLRTIIDLDMNRVASITILKDASSTALYGARAANGVIVVTTRQPKGGAMRISYTADFRVDMPDLSDYNMMNAEEKLQFEKLAGRFTDPRSDVTYRYQPILDTLYNNRLAVIRKGVNTDWLNIPLRTGFTNGHSIYADGGDEQLRYGIGATYRNTQGLMKGSDRETWGANIDMMYRKGKLSIANKLYINGNRSSESPYGSFSTFVNASPYYTPYDKDGQLNRLLQTAPADPYFVGFSNIGNPMYNASLNSKDFTKGFTVQNNLQSTYRFNHEMQLETAVQLSKADEQRTVFNSPEDTMFDNTSLYERGNYYNGKSNNFSYRANVMFTYAKAFAEKHVVTTFLRGDIEQSQDELFGARAVGFPFGSNGDPAFSFGYQSNSKPETAYKLYRRNNLLGSLNYVFDQRFLLDATYRLDGSTAFGSERKYSPFWSVGAGWNLHNEKFLKSDYINLLRLRGSIGITGNQNFGSISSVSIFAYNSNTNILGQGVLLQNFGNENLEWQKTVAKNIGLDFSLFNNKVSGNFNAYEKITDPLVVVVDLPSSTGIYGYATNVGNLKTRGLEGNLRFTPVFRPKGLIWSVGLTASLIRSKYGKFNNQLNTLNQKQLVNNSLVRYTDGHSPDDIWAVRSSGIDPATGREVFINAAGESTFTYSTNDITVVGNSRPKVEGVISTNLSYKGFQFGLNLRYGLGGDLFNAALYNKVENISNSNIGLNQNRQALYDRWQKPGDISSFKSISLSDYTPISSRFVQRDNVIIGESFTVGYWVDSTRWLKKLGMKTFRFNIYANDIFRYGTVKAERGIDYPFANTISSSVNISF